MPKLSEEAWELRQRQILVAALRCFTRFGVQATTVEQIIIESEMSTSAMYRYFKGKDDIVFAAISMNLRDFATLAGPILSEAKTKSPSEFVHDALVALDGYAQRDGFNLKAIIVQGWGESFTNARLGELLKEVYSGYLQGLSQVVSHWRATGVVQEDVKPRSVAVLLMSTILGAIVQSCIVGSKPSQHAKGLSGLMSPLTH